MTQAEIAARRSESAIKRKHLTEKKLEDDKVKIELTGFFLIFTRGFSI